MKLLGLSAGNPDGSAEILLKEALRGAARADVELVRLHELRLSGSGDDAAWFWNPRVRP